MEIINLYLRKKQKANYNPQNDFSAEPKTKRL